MPMIPSVLGVGVYTAVKLGGYAAFAAGLNRVARRDVPVFRFAVVKTLIGLAGGFTYLLVLPALIRGDPSDLVLWAGAIPVRLLVWSLVLGWFYGFRVRPGLMSLAVIAGVAWSYALDAVMGALFFRLPGMMMPFC